MIRKLFVCLLAWFILVPSFAQEESVSKQINQIKRDAAFLYSEATLETAEKALDAARTTLMSQVQEYLELNQKTVTLSDALRQSIYAKTSSLEMMRGTQYRVFVYVQKSDVNAILGIGQQQTQYSKTPVSPSLDKTVKEKADVTNLKAAEMEEKQVQAATTLAPSTASDKAQVSVPKAVNDPGLPAWQMMTIEDLLKCGDSNEVRAKLNRMKAEYKIKKYGTPDNCQKPESAFWLIFSQDGSVNTILGPGTKERVSFRDMTTSELDNYKGMNALWFNFAK